MSLNIALIGSAIQAAEHITLRAIFSRSSKSATAIAKDLEGCDVYSKDGELDYKDLIARKDIDAVIIALPIKDQKEYIRDALLAGKHVLSEKPVLENVKEAVEMIKWYRTEIHSATWSIAENWRFLKSFNCARDMITKLGKIIGFQVRMFDCVQEEWNFFQTDWRKTPTHQGGFLLDGGVHFIAGMRLLLAAQPGNEIKQLSANTTLIKPFLPPVDTINACLKTVSGISGVVQLSFGTSLRGNEWTVACEGGVVSVNDSEITQTINGKVEKVSKPNERTGVPPVVRAWSEALVEGKVSPEQEPEPAFADLELIELMLRSGELDGKSMICKHQFYK
ncbi:NAD-binding Rossmann fold oxidoreductase family protein [Tricladium varicosporioides]|nr:NAD-binding Rossmann fold oxidoreductase family protein [Hymenoscyphus varicosporioides]